LLGIESIVLDNRFGNRFLDLGEQGLPSRSFIQRRIDLDRWAKDDRHWARPDFPIAYGQDAIPTADGHRHDRHASLYCDGKPASLKGEQVAVLAAGSFWKKENGNTCLQECPDVADSGDCLGATFSINQDLMGALQTQAKDWDLAQLVFGNPAKLERIKSYHNSHNIKHALVGGHKDVRLLGLKLFLAAGVDSGATRPQNSLSPQANETGCPFCIWIKERHQEDRHTPEHGRYNNKEDPKNGE
jgi:hypothetical protein